MTNSTDRATEFLAKTLEESAYDIFDSVAESAPLTLATAGAQGEDALIDSLTSLLLAQLSATRILRTARAARERKAKTSELMHALDLAGFCNKELTE